MAIRAPAAQLALVAFLLVGFLVAGIAVGRRLVLVQVPGVAFCAGRLGMLAMKDILRVLVMVEGDFFPFFRRVTGPAFLPEFSFVAILVFVVVLTMATDALLG